jgi:hypothetical protein
VVAETDVIGIAVGPHQQIVECGLFVCDDVERRFGALDDEVIGPLA